MKKSPLRRDLRVVFGEGVAFSGMVGIGESYIAAFVLALGMGEVTAGLVATIPLLAGGFIQLVTPLGIERLGSRRLWSVFGASLQALSFVPLVVGAAAGRLPVWAVFVVTSMYWASGMAVGPAWNVWVEDIVPRGVRTVFFARRTSAMQLGVLVSLLAGGAMLSAASARGRVLVGFAVIFSLALLFRTFSARLLAAQREPRSSRRELQNVPVTREGLVRFVRGSGGRLFTYLLALTCSVMISAPYFSPFMLVHLELPYWQYTTLLGTALLSKVVALPLLAIVARRFGLARVLRLAWLGVAPVPALWLLATSWVHLFPLHVLSGTAWAAHEYVTFLLLFETIPARQRVTALTAYNFANAVATVVGSLAGAAIFASVGGGSAGYVAIFGTSSIARALCLVLVVRVRGAELPDGRVVFRLIGVRPSTGAILRPILSTIRGRRSGRVEVPDESKPR